MDTLVVIDYVIASAVKVIVLVGITALLWLVVHRRSAAFQHFVLSLGFAGFSLLPLVASIAPVIPVNAAILGEAGSALIHGLAQAAQSLSRTWDVNTLLLVAAIYLLPATTLLFYLLLGVVGLWWQARGAQPVKDKTLLDKLAALRELIDIHRPVTLMTSRDVESPKTWGVLSPVILLPREALVWDEDKQISILVHELGHVARWDWMTTLMVKMVCALFWWLLPMWWLAKGLYQQAEIACDDYIYRLRDKQAAFAKSLLDIALAQQERVDGDTALYMHGRSAIHQRILAVLDQQRPHHAIATESAQYWVITGSLILILIAGVQGMPVPARTDTQSTTFLNLLWRELPAAKAVHTDPVRHEVFSWELLQSLKPATSAMPLPLELIEPAGTIEEVEIVAIQPTPAEANELRHIPFRPQPQRPVPHIQVEGFLPVHLVTPEYPEKALRKGIEGWVEVEFTIDHTGAIVAPRVVAASPSHLFERKVLTALKQSRYRPQTFDGQPIVVQGVREVFRFTLLDQPSSARGADSPTTRRR